MRIHSLFIVLCLCFFFSKTSKASHIIGGEIGYASIGGLDYEVTVTLYGDCAGNAFPLLPNSIPRVEVYNYNVSFSFIDLQLIGPGEEVTPVCPASANNTTCVNSNGTVPGIMRFIYKGNITLDAYSAGWKFIFNSTLGGASAAGRTNAITNISPNSRMALEATLNNANGTNNSSLFTTIPTPFFCINLPQEFNQGATDPDGDQLSFSLTPGLDADNNGTVVGSVNYIPPYTYLNPLATAAGSFLFNSTNGQMSFTPNLIQTSLVVNKVTETRGGVIVGSTMREMNLIVLDNCSNLPPFASIPSSTYGTFTSTRTLSICNSVNNLQFVINVSDPNNQSVQTSVSGLPSGATANISGNNTQSPIITINWNLPQPVLPGVYNFYVQCEDDGCPLTSKQTFAYTVIILQPISPILTSIINETCVPGSDGSIAVSASSNNGNVLFSIDGINFQSSNIFPQLNAGTYSITVKDIEGCTRAETAMVNYPTRPIVTATTNTESCIPGKDASIDASATSANGMIQAFSLNGGIPQTNGSFINLQTGVYTIQVTDIIGCTQTSIVQINAPILPVLGNPFVTNITCYGLENGRVEVNVNPPNIPYTFTLLPTNSSNVTGIFSSLSKNTYTLLVSDTKLCADTISFSILEPEPLFITATEIQDATCDKNNGQLRVTTNSTSPIIYTLRHATLINTTGFFDNIPAGVYTLYIRDTNFCTAETIIEIEQVPNLFSSTITQKDLGCNGYGYEGEAEVFVQGGEPPYSYLWSAPASSFSSKADKLYFGWYFVTVTDATGCELQDTVYIKPGSCCENIILPNAFSPNGDGKNDTWHLITSTGMQIQHFGVYNRWGERVWEARDQRETWDGKQKQSDAPIGTYFYYLKYKCLSDQKYYSKKGDILLVR